MAFALPGLGKTLVFKGDCRNPLRGGGEVKGGSEDTRPHDLRTIQSLVAEYRQDFWRHGMSFSASAADERVLDVESTDDTLTVSLHDGRVISVALVWYPRLLNATAAQRKNW